MTGASAVADSSQGRASSWAGVRPYVVLAGRVFSALIFVMAALGHLSAQTIGYAASQTDAGPLSLDARRKS